MVPPPFDAATSIARLMAGVSSVRPSPFAPNALTLYMPEASAFVTEGVRVFASCWPFATLRQEAKENNIRRANRRSLFIFIAISRRILQLIPRDVLVIARERSKVRVASKACDLVRRFQGRMP